MAVTPNYKSTGLRPLFGTWTHTEGAEEETFAVAGLVYGGIFTDCDTTGGHNVSVPFSVSRDTSTGISTITIHNQAAVTDGRYIIWVSSM